MKKNYFIFMIVLFLSARLISQPICSSAGNLMLFTNYDGGTLTINCDQNITNLKIGVCSYEAIRIVLTGAFVGNVTAVHYAGYNGNNNTSCGPAIPTTTIVGAPSSAVTTTVFAPPANFSNSFGYSSIICGYSCSNNSNQGGCNTVDQIEAYFLAYFTGSSLYAHKVQYNCWTGTHAISGGGNCCPPQVVNPGGVSASQSICPGQVPAAFSNTLSASSSTSAVTYTWQSSTTSASSGFSNIGSANSSTYAAGALSTTTYFRRAASTGTVVAYSNAVAVTVLPAPNLSISGNTAVCVGSSAVVQGNGASSYTWYPGPVTGSSFTITSPSSSVYTLSGSSAANCTATIPFVIVVNPTPTISAVATNTNACEGKTLILTGFGGNTYTFMPGGVVANSIVITATASTVYTITGQNANTGCKSTVQIPINVISPPTLTLSVVSMPVCTGTEATLVAQGASVYTWSPGNFSGNTMTFVPIASAIYTVFGFNGTCSATSTLAINVLPSPSLTLSSIRSVICSGQNNTLTATGASNYSWTSGSTTITNASLVVSPPSTSVYSVTGSVSNGCYSKASITVSVSACAGILDKSIKNSSFILYPNPNDGRFTISAINNLQVFLFSGSGALIKKIELNENNHHAFEILDLPPGIYFINSEVDALKQKVIVN